MGELCGCDLLIVAALADAELPALREFAAGRGFDVRPSQVVGVLASLLSRAAWVERTFLEMREIMTGPTPMYGVGRKQAPMTPEAMAAHMM